MRNVINVVQKKDLEILNINNMIKNNISIKFHKSSFENAQKYLYENNIYWGLLNKRKTNEILKYKIYINGGRCFNSYIYIESFRI